MGQVLHGSATTTAAIRRAIQHSQESLRVLARVTASIQRRLRSGDGVARQRIFGPVRRFHNLRCSR
jgi:hypothetical protein